MLTPTSRRWAESRRVPLAAALLALLALALGVVTPIQAHAAVNPGIEVTGLTLIKSDRDGNNASGGLTNQDVAKLSYNWDATKTTVKSGDSFSINLGTYFKNLEYPISAPMQVTYNGQLTEIGTCELSEKEVVCTFSSKVDELRNAGFTDFKGAGMGLLLITQTTTASSVDMTVNGSQTVSVKLPGSGGISGVAPTVYTPFKFTKMSSVINSSSTSMIWEVNFGSDYIKQGLANGSSPITVDGATRDTIVITDTLGAGMTYGTDMSKWFLMVRNSAAEPNLAGVAVTNAAGTDLNNTYGDFDMSVDVDGQVATITITGPLAAKTNYKISYPVTFTSKSGKATVGVQYGNQASLNNSGIEGEFTRSYAESFKVTVEMAAGFGGFEVLKSLKGSALDSVDVASTTLDVAVDYTLPGPASAYTGWSAPGTLNADGMSGSTTMKVHIGKTSTFPATFPKGTVVTLSEDTASASPKPEGYAWMTPEFTVGNQATSTFTIADQTSTKVSLVNIAEPAEEPGTFQVKKSASGAEGAGTKDYTFSYTCSDGQSGTVMAKGDGAAVAADKTFAPGTTCTVTEDASAAAIDGYTLTAPEAQTVTIGAATAEVATAEFTNTYTRDMGAFSIAKSVQGGEDGFAKSAFSFTYTCTDGTEGTLSVPGDGTAVTSPRLPAGATCTVAEDAASAARAGYSVASSLSQDTVTIGKDETVAVTATNTYTRDTSTFTVKKAVEGDYAPAAGDSVKVTYTCDDAETTSGTLEVPMDGTAVDGPALPTGTSCTLSEDAASAHRDGFSVTTAYSSPTVTIVKDQVAEATVTNTYTRLTGGFSVSKTVQGDGAALAGDKDFTFTYTCTDAVTGKATVSEELTLKAGETKHVADVPTGSCTVTEKDAAIERASWNGALSVNGKAVDGAKATFDITGQDAAAVAVSATNTYTLDRGTFSVAKTVAGDGAEEHQGRSFIVEYSCTSVEGDRAGEIQVPGDGSAVGSGIQLPIGAECSVAERGSSAQVAGYDVAIPQAQTVTISKKDETAALSLTNTYTRHTGTFSVLKTVTGAQVGDKEFSFAYTCTDGSEGALSVKADGEAVSGPALPTGTQCTITEDAAAAELEGHTLAAPQAQTVTISDKDEVVATTFINAYAESPEPPAPTPGESPTPGEPTPSGEQTPPATASAPGPSLARTGISVGLPMVMILAAMIGGVALVRRRRG